MHTQSREDASGHLLHDIEAVEEERELKKAARLERKRQKEARIRSERRQRLVAPLILIITILLGCLAMLL